MPGMSADDAFDRVRSDATLRAVLEAARSWGVPPSVFLDGGPAQTLVIERDAAGRTSRIVDRTWTHDDRVLALAFHAYEADRCDGCGLPLSETTTKEAEFAYATPKPVRCHACTDIAIAASAEERKHPQALRWPVHRKTPLTVVAEQTEEVPP